VSDKRGALEVPAAALATQCPDLEILDVSSQFQLDESSLSGLAACPRLRRLVVGWPVRAGAARLQAQLPGLVVE
jgi:hypothetical protein